MNWMLKLKVELQAVVLILIAAVASADVTVGNSKFTLTIGDDAVPKSLVVKSTGEEVLASARGRPLFSVTQERPFNNEVKLSYPNARTTYRAKAVRREGNVLRIAFEQAQYEALVRVRETGSYVAFTLEGFDRARDAYSYLKLDCPPVSEFRLLELPVRRRAHLGGWLNVMWDDRSAVAVIASSVDELISHEKRDDGALLIADALKSVKVVGTTAILVASETPAFLDCVEQAEIGFGMPRGVASRRSREIRQSTLSTFACPTNVDEVIAFAKQGGFRNVMLGYKHIVREGPSWCRCGDYDFRDDYPNGYDDLRLVLGKLKAAGLTPGLHVLATHIGMCSRYVTPVADHRLGLTRHYTLAKPLPPDATVAEVEEDPMRAPEFPDLRVLRFGGELMRYEGRSATRPYAFTGLVRGAFGTRVTAHPLGEIGGVLDVSEYGGTNNLGTCYLDPDSSLADEVAEKIARLYNCGMEFIYLDGSEGVKAPYGHYVALAQKRVWDKLKVAPKFGEGAAKAHFSWHMLSAANAYDRFPPSTFERDTAIHPVEGAKLMANDFSQVDFGWWSIVGPYEDGSGVRHAGTTPEMWEWGFKLAVGYDAPVTVQIRDLAALKSSGACVDELLAVSRRWLEAREKGFFTPEMKARLRDTSVRHSLVRDAHGRYELRERAHEGGATSGVASGEITGTDAWAGRRRHLAVVNAPVPVDDGTVVSLSGEWEFCSFRHRLGARDFFLANGNRDYWGGPGAWQTVRKIMVPGCWEAQGVGDEGLARSWNGAPYHDFALRHVHRGNGLYRRAVSLPESWRGKRIWLKVGRVGTWGWFWVNGTAVAHTEDSCRTLKWEVTDLVRFGEPFEVMAEIDNSYAARNPAGCSINHWGGLLRDVELEATPGTFIDDAWVRGDFDGRKAEVMVKVGTDDERRIGNLSLRVTVEDEAKEVRLRSSPSDFSLAVPLRSFRPWSPEHPNLYTARVELVSAAGEVLQRRYERFGVRKLEVRGKEFFLNGRPFFFRGFGDDATYPITGCSPASKSYHLRHLKMARAAGCNFVRTHTHFEVPEYFDAADEVGILVQGELHYDYDGNGEETFAYDPLGDAKAAWEEYRRHPSYAILSGGNEGTHGPMCGRLLCRWVRQNDPDRLFVEQDGGTYMRGHDPETSTHASGPMQMWERGSFNKRAFICHEYGNVAVKGDARMEADYTGVWKPRLTRAGRRANLAPAGLGNEWGDLLQDAQHDFQRYWFRRSVEHARKDPFCDGYILWTIVDYTHWDRVANAPMCQGVFDPFWRVKPHGTTVADLATVNSETAIGLDTENIDRVWREDPDPLLCCGVMDKTVIDETNRVYVSGSSIPAEFILSHYGEDELKNARLEWSLAANGRTLASGVRCLGDVTAAPARRVGRESIVIPDLDTAVRATLTAAVVACGDGGVATSTRCVNAWDFWLFPQTADPQRPEGVVIAGVGTPEAEKARREGRNLLLTANLKGPRDIFYGWWSVTWRNTMHTPKRNLSQNGVAIRRHPLFREFPYEPYLTPLLFGILGTGTSLPLAGFEEKDFIAVGEGNSDFKLYLAAKERADGGREVFVSGLDIFSDAVEARTLLSDIYRYLSK